jgi:hypothetical protein
MAKKPPDKQKPEPPKGGGPTGQGKGADGPPRDLSKVPPQLREHAHAPGSNGGVHRGRDLNPRHFVRSMYLKATTDEGYVARDPYTYRSGAQKRKRAKDRHALIHNVTTAIQSIALDAAEGDAVARGQLLRFMKDFHEMLQPAQDEAKSGGGPILPKFNRPVRSSPASAPEVPPEDLPAVVDEDGNPYVDAG